MSSRALNTTANIFWVLAFVATVLAFNALSRMLLFAELFLVLWFVFWLCARRQRRLESLPQPIRPEDYQKQ